MADGHDSDSGLLRTIRRTTRDATNRQDANNPRETDVVQNELEEDPGTPAHNGSTKVLVATYDPGDYVLEGRIGGKVLLFRYERANGMLDPGATTENSKIYSTADAAIRSINQANRRTWARGPKYNNGARQTFQAKP